MITTGAQCERWMEATWKELQAFLMPVCWEGTYPRTTGTLLCSQEEVCRAVTCLQPQKPMTPEKKALGLLGDQYEKARICLQGQNHEGFQAWNSTANLDARLRLLLAVHGNPKHVLASFDDSNASLNADLSEDAGILTQPAPELIQFGLVKPGALYQGAKACYGLSVGRSQRQDFDLLCVPH